MVKIKIIKLKTKKQMDLNNRELIIIFSQKKSTYSKRFLKRFLFKKCEETFPKI